MPETTPGEVAYERYVAAMEAQAELFPWRFLPPRTQHAWEAAAQAVRAMAEILMQQEDDPHA